MAFIQMFMQIADEPICIVKVCWIMYGLGDLKNKGPLGDVPKGSLQ